MDVAPKIVWKSWIVAANHYLVSCYLIYTKCPFFFWTCTLWCMDMTYKNSRTRVSSKKCYFWAWKFHTSLVLAQGGITTKPQPDSLNVADVLAELQSLLPRISLPLSLRTERDWELESHKITLNQHFVALQKAPRIWWDKKISWLAHNSIFSHFLLNHYNVFQCSLLPQGRILCSPISATLCWHKKCMNTLFLGPLRLKS